MARNWHMQPVGRPGHETDKLRVLASIVCQQQAAMAFPPIGGLGGPQPAIVVPPGGTTMVPAMSQACRTVEPKPDTIRPGRNNHPLLG